MTLNELQKTIRQYCQKDLTEFVEDIVDFFAKRLVEKKITFADFDEDVQGLVDPRGKN